MKKVDAFDVYMDVVVGGFGITDAEETFHEAYVGEYSSLEEYAKELLDELYPLPDTPYVLHDVEQFAYDMELEGYVWADGHVFRPV